MKKFWVPALGLIATSLMGCHLYDYDQVEMSKEYQKVADVKRDWSYVDRIYVSAKDLWWDAFDIFSFDLSFGEGFLANVHATRHGNLGLGWFDGIRVGWLQRASGTWSERGYEYGLGPFYWKNKTRQPIYGNRPLFERGLEFEGFELDSINKDGHTFDVGGRVHLFLIGMSADASPKELVDFGSSLVQLVYTTLLWPLGAVYDLDPPMIDLSDDNELSRLRKTLGTQSAQIYQPSSPWLERTGVVYPPVREKGTPMVEEFEADEDSAEGMDSPLH